MWKSFRAKIIRQKFSPQSSRLAEFGGLGMSFNICRGTLGSLVMFTAIRNDKPVLLAADSGDFADPTSLGARWLRCRLRRAFVCRRSCRRQDQAHLGQRLGHARAFASAPAEIVSPRYLFSRALTIPLFWLFRWGVLGTARWVRA
jgi:hypothetical protein